MPTLSVCPVQFASENKAVLRRVKSDAFPLVKGATVLVKVRAEWAYAAHVDLDWHWVECVIEWLGPLEILVRTRTHQA